MTYLAVCSSIKAVSHRRNNVLEQTSPFHVKGAEGKTRTNILPNLTNLKYVLNKAERRVRNCFGVCNEFWEEFMCCVRCKETWDDKKQLFY